MPSAIAPAPLRGVRATAARRALLAALLVAVPLASCGGTSTAPVAPAATAVASASASAPAAPPPVFPPDWPYKQGAPTPRSAKGMVVTDESIATKVGADVLASGGN